MEASGQRDMGPTHDKGKGPLAQGKNLFNAGFAMTVK